MHIRYKPRINLGIVSEREGIDYAARYARLASQIIPDGTIAPTPTVAPTPSYVAPVTSKPSPPAYLTDPTARPPTYEQDPAYWGYRDPREPFYTTMPVTPPIIQPLIEERDYAAIPEPFRYSKEQIMDMLARGASETYERTGETDSGLPVEVELEQISRELDATKQYAVDADGTIVPTEPRIAAGAGLGWLAAAVVGFLVLGG